jgi:hypothetical protein
MITDSVFIPNGRNADLFPQVLLSSNPERLKISASRTSRLAFRILAVLGDRCLSIRSRSIRAGVLGWCITNCVLRRFFMMPLRHTSAIVLVI